MVASFIPPRSRLVPRRPVLPIAPQNPTFPNISKIVMESFEELPLLQEVALKGRPLFSSGATAAEDCVSDISYFVRTFMPESAPTQAIGVTSGENVFQGAWAAFKAWCRFQRAYQVNDTGGMIEGGLDTVRGGGQFVAGVAYTGYRGTMIACDVKNIIPSMSAAAPVGKAAFLTGYIGNIGFGIFYAAFALWSAFGLCEDYAFSEALKAHESSPKELFEFLVGEMTTDPKSQLEELSQRGQAYKETLANLALDKLTEAFLHIQEQLAEDGKSPLSESKVRQTLKELFEARDAELHSSHTYENYLSSLGLKEADLPGLTMLELMGFKLMEMNHQSKKEDQFSRAAGNASLEAVQKAARRGLAERLASHDPLVQKAAENELAALKERVTLGNTSNKIIHSALLAVGVFGVAVTVLGFFIASPPAIGITLFVMTIALCVALKAADGYVMDLGWNNGPPGEHDKKYVIIAALLLAIGIAVSIYTTCGLALLAPLMLGIMYYMPLIYACGMGAVGLALLGYAYYKLDEKEKKWIEDHPNFAVFQKMLQESNRDEALDDKTTAVFKKLSKIDRRQVKEKYFEMSQVRQMQFRSEEYLHLELAHDFGEEYLNEFNDPSLTRAEYKLLVSGVKKTVKLFWEKYALEKSEKNKKAALQLQSLFELLAQEELDEFEEKLSAIRSNDEAYDALKQNIWYVVKRQESKADLDRVIDDVLGDRAAPAKLNALPKLVLKALS